MFLCHLSCLSFLWLNFFSRFKKNLCQLNGERCAQITGNLPIEGLPRNCVAKINDRLIMTLAVDCIILKRDITNKPKLMAKVPVICT